MLISLEKRKLRSLKRGKDETNILVHNLWRQQITQMKNKMPEKPKTTKGQIDTLWDICANHILTSLKWQDTKINFVLVFTGLILAFVAALAIIGLIR